jgi:hypothetical protein
MRNAQRRMEQLEARIRGVWPVEVAAAKQRALGRVRLKLTMALGALDHPACTADAALLADDTPEHAEADTAILQRWARQHPATLYPVDGGREHIAAKLEEMARRLQAGKEDHEPEDAAYPFGAAGRPQACMGGARRVGGR